MSAEQNKRTVRVDVSKPGDVEGQLLVCMCKGLGVPTDMSEGASTREPRHLSGWLTVRSGRLREISERCFFRLKWGFLNQYTTDMDHAKHRYCMHAAQVTSYLESRKIVVQLGPLGALMSHGTDIVSDDTHVMRRNDSQRSYDAGARKRSAKKRSASRVEHDSAGQASSRLVLIADTDVHTTLWAAQLQRACARSLLRRYNLLDRVGSGAAGDVFCGHGVQDPTLKVAVKRLQYIYNGSNGSSDSDSEISRKRLRRIQKEIQTQHKASKRSTYVASIYDVFFDSRHCYLVLELVQGGSLRDWLNTRGVLDEDVAISIVQKLAQCVLAMHSCSIVHRDLKPENCLLELDEEQRISTLKLIDFGFAEMYRGGEVEDFCDDFLGTPSFMAPEIASFERYGAPVDMYALGMLTYSVLTGSCLFDDTPRLRDILLRVKEGNMSKVVRNRSLSPHAKSFCLSLLQADPRKRLSAAGALQHAWLRRGRNVASVPQPVPQSSRLPRALLRKAFVAISVMNTLRRWARSSSPRPVRPGRNYYDQNRVLDQLELELGEVARRPTSSVRYRTRR